MAHSPQDDALLHPESDNDFLHHLKAIEILRERFDATPEEIAVWVFWGSIRGGLDTGKPDAVGVDAGWVDPGGLRAFLGLDPDGARQRFRFSSETDSDYTAQLTHCFFRPADLSAFEPLDRYLSYRQLLQRWTELYNDRGAAEGQIRAKAANVEGLVLHPQTGTTSGSHPTVGWSTLPPLETGMFSRRAVEKIEKGWGVTAAQSSDGLSQTKRATWAKQKRRNDRIAALKAFLVMIDALATEHKRGWDPMTLPVSKRQFHDEFILRLPAYKAIAADTLADDVKHLGWSFQRGRESSQHNPLATLLRPKAKLRP